MELEFMELEFQNATIGLQNLFIYFQSIITQLSKSRVLY